LNPVCYLSKFTLEDRIKKESFIEDTNLLIATQVVEVSLDIDFDVMFCECAPRMQLFKRAGRVNRRRVKQIVEYSFLKLQTYLKGFMIQIQPGC
jgi:CRISPR-associated endonuclease/helicase Cas3